MRIKDLCSLTIDQNYEVYNARCLLRWRLTTPFSKVWLYLVLLSVLRKLISLDNEWHFFFFLAFSWILLPSGLD